MNKKFYAKKYDDATQVKLDVFEGALAQISGVNEKGGALGDPGSNIALAQECLDGGYG
jgi:hypothetical protein